MTWLLIDVGCAECRRNSSTTPLVQILGSYATCDAAKAAANVEIQEDGDGVPIWPWAPHPQGGEFYGHGSGDLWVVPVSAFTSPKFDVSWPDD